MRQGLNQLWLVLILGVFGAPLFVGLGSTDLANDEAIYSYAVESILTTGDWMSPRSSPNPDITFLEKPPLKFWIVAAGIRLGLPHNEFGMRFWDAVFGAAAFVYVFLIGRRFAGAVCGAVAVLVLFAHEPLLFDHGLRSNNMDAALLLAYAGGVYHYLRWSDESRTEHRTWHLGGVAAFFFLAFMMKFVAAFFLPAVLALAAVSIPAHRRRLAQDWRHWLVAGVVVLLCALPWFLYQYYLHQNGLLRVMFGEHVYTRFTAFADPAHVQPWHFYVSAAYREVTKSGSALLAGLGLVYLTLATVRRTSPEAIVIAIWLVFPVALISMGSSKLYHYLYPYLPPLALAAGGGVAWIVRAAGRRLTPIERAEWRVSPWMRTVAWVITAAAAAIALGTEINDGLRVYAGGHLLFRNTSVTRPLVIAAIGLAVAGSLRAGVALVAVLLVQTIMPTPLAAYAGHLRRLKTVDRPLSTLARCLREVDDRQPGTSPAPGIYAPVWEAFLHPYFYYLRGTGWASTEIDDSQLRAALGPGGQPRPVALDQARYIEFRTRTSTVNDRLAEVPLRGIIVALPGDYAACATRMSGSR